MRPVVKITDFSAPELDVYARLSERELLHAFDPSPGLFIAESPKVITRALDAGYAPVSFLMEPQHAEGQGREVIARCPEDVPVYTAPLDVLTRLTGFRLTRGMLCAMRRRELPGAEEICAGARRVAVLESVMNPTNVGAIFRSAAALGVDAVLLTDDCSDPFYRRAARVAMGTVFQVPWTFLDGNAENALKMLETRGFLTAALALSDESVSLDDPRLHAAERLALALGAEGDGLRPETVEACALTVKIPMYHGVDSLNVAAASAVAFWELRPR